MTLEQLAEDLWVATGRVRFVGQWIPARMLVVRPGRASRERDGPRHFLIR